MGVWIVCISYYWMVLLSTPLWLQMPEWSGEGCSPGQWRGCYEAWGQQGLQPDMYRHTSPNPGIHMPIIYFNSLKCFSTMVSIIFSNSCMPAFNSCLALLADMILKCVALTVVFPCVAVCSKYPGVYGGRNLGALYLEFWALFCLAGENACFFSNKGNYLTFIWSTCVHLCFLWPHSSPGTAPSRWASSMATGKVVSFVDWNIITKFAT